MYVSTSTFSLSFVKASFIVYRKGDIVMDPMNSKDVLPKNVPGVGLVMWGGSCRGGVGWVKVGWGGVTHGRVGWGGSCRGGWVMVGWGGVGCIMQGWVGHVGMGWGGS